MATDNDAYWVCSYGTSDSPGSLRLSDSHRKVFVGSALAKGDLCYLLPDFLLKLCPRKVKRKIKAFSLARKVIAQLAGSFFSQCVIRAAFGKAWQSFANEAHLYNSSLRNTDGESAECRCEHFSCGDFFHGYKLHT